MPTADDEPKKAVKLGTNIFVAAAICAVCGGNKLSLIVGDTAVCLDCFTKGVLNWSQERLKEMGLT